MPTVIVLASNHYWYAYFDLKTALLGAKELLENNQNIEYVKIIKNGGEFFNKLEKKDFKNLQILLDKSNEI